MKQYKAGFELDDQEEVQKQSPDSSRTAGDDAGVAVFSYKKGFTLDQEPEQARVITVSDVDPSNLTTLEFAEEDDSSDDEIRTRFWSSPLLWILMLVIVLGGLQVYQLLVSAFNQSLIAGGAWSVGLSVVMTFVFSAVFRELHSVWMLKNSDKNRMQIRRILETGSGQEAISLCRNMYKNVSGISEQSYQTFLKRVQPHFSPAEVFELYENVILQELDRKAKNIVIKRSQENGVVVALSPIAWLDMAFTVARSLRMIREVAETYGYHCGLWGRLQLYRKIIKNIIFIGITDLATDAIMDSIGAETFAKLSAAVGQGLAAGIYSTRLGYMTIKAVRPIPISKRVVTLAELRKSMVAGALDVLKKRDDQGKK